MTTQLRDTTTTEHRFIWQQLLRWATIAVLVEYVTVMALVEKAVIPPLVIVMAVLVVGLVRMRSGGDKGVRVTTVGFGLSLLVDLVFALPNLLVAASLPSFAITWAALATTLVGLVAGVARWRGRTASGATARVAFAGIGIAAIAVVFGLTASLGYTDAKPAPGDIVVKAKDSSFVPTNLTASQGQATFFLDNADNTLHNFVITGASGAGKTMPANHKARYSVTLAPGTYEYHCDFHNDMKGTLTVS
ncbi:MAG: Cupredoxin-like domain [Acidimicrobiaceae bacterium]|jgi:plastocyanin